MNTIDPVTFISPNVSLEQLAGVGLGQTGPSSEFAQWIEHELSLVNKQINTSDMELRKFAVGETDSIHHLMMSLEKARLSFQMLTQVRNKALEAYQDVMRMQI